MWELDHKERWEPKNWCFWTVVLEKTLESPLDCKEIKPVNPKGNESWYSLEEWMLKVKAWYFGHLMRRTNTLEKTLKSGGEGDNRGQDHWMTSLTQWTWDWANPGRWWRAGKPDVLQSMGLQIVVHDWVTEQKNPKPVTRLLGDSQKLCLVSQHFISCLQTIIYLKGKNDSECHDHFSMLLSSHCSGLTSPTYLEISYF